MDMWPGGNARAADICKQLAAAQIRAGAVHLNYTECLRPDAPVAPGDVLSLRGAGKGSVAEVGGMSRKGRQFVTAELWQ